MRKIPVTIPQTISSHSNPEVIITSFSKLPDFHTRCAKVLDRIQLMNSDRHGGSGPPLAPATPPYMRVRIRRFGRVELPRQARKTDRVEVSVGKREAESRAIRQVPRASALPLLPDHGAQSASRPLIQSVQHRGSLAVAEVPFPAA